jgi:hypothetical protein
MLLLVYICKMHTLTSIDVNHYTISEVRQIGNDIMTITHPSLYINEAEIE